MKFSLSQSAAVIALTAALTFARGVNAQQYTFNRALGAPSGVGHLTGPTAVTLDSSGAVYVTTLSGSPVTIFNSAGVFLRVVGNRGQVSTPFGVGVDAIGNLFVDDYSGNKIVEYNNAGMFTQEIYKESLGKNALYQSIGLTVDSAGNLYAPDTGENRLVEFSNSGVFLRSIGSAGAGNGQLSAPQGVAVDGMGNLYVADTGNNRVVLYNNAGVFLRNIGGAGTGNGQLNGPVGVAVDSRQNVFVSDAGNHRLVEFDSQGNWAQNIGDASFGSAALHGPQGIYADSGGNLYVADITDNRVVEYSPVGIHGAVTLEACSDPAQNLVFTFRPTGGGASFTRRQVLTPAGSATGTFAFTDIPFGTYDIAIKGFSWLQKTTPGVVFSASAPPPVLNVTLTTGDLNGDNFVDSSDFGLLIGNYNDAGDP